MTDGCRYPNQQLKLVSAEVYFAGRMSTLLRLDELQQALLPQFSNLLVPISRNDLAPALQPYQLTTEGGAEAVSVAVNQIAFAMTQYPGFQNFGSRAEQLISDALKLFGIGSIDRVVFRYENEIGVQKSPDGAVPVRDVFKLGMEQWCEGQPITLVDFRWNTKLDRGIQFGHLRTEDHPTGSLIKLSVGAIVMPAGESTNLREYLALAHDRAVACFERVITDEFRAFISQKKENG